MALYITLHKHAKLHCMRQNNHCLKIDIRKKYQVSGGVKKAGLSYASEGFHFKIRHQSSEKDDTYSFGMTAITKGTEVALKAFKHHI